MANIVAVFEIGQSPKLSLDIFVFVHETLLIVNDLNLRGQAVYPRRTPKPSMKK